jgi:hypothetical protein
MDDANIDPLGIRLPRRKKIPPGLRESIDGVSCIYETEVKFNEEGEEIDEPTNFSVVWFCPPPELGPVIVVVNFRRKHSDLWESLTYSLKESTVR